MGKDITKKTKPKKRGPPVGYKKKNQQIKQYSTYQWAQPYKKKYQEVENENDQLKQIVEFQSEMILYMKDHFGKAWEVASNLYIQSQIDIETISSSQETINIENNLIDNLIFSQEINIEKRINNFIEDELSNLD